MRRAPSRSPPAFADQLFQRNVQGLAFAKQLQSLDRFAPSIGARALDGYKPRDRAAVFGDRELFASSDSFEQGGQVGLGLVGTNFRITVTTGLRLV
jgi:hypothetical protein